MFLLARISATLNPLEARGLLCRKSWFRIASCITSNGPYLWPMWLRRYSLANNCYAKPRRSLSSEFLAFPSNKSGYRFGNSRKKVRLFNLSSSRSLPSIKRT